jgi:hypothetical protein
MKKVFKSLLFSFLSTILIIIIGGFLWMLVDIVVNYLPGIAGIAGFAVILFISLFISFLLTPDDADM